MDTLTITHPAPNVTVLHSVSELLRSYIGSHIYELNGQERIVFDSPAHMDAAGETVLSLYLYQTQINPYLRNLPPAIGLDLAEGGRDANIQLTPPPLVLDLLYMMVPYARTSDIELLLVDRLVALFGSSVELVPSIDDAALRATGNVSFNVIPEDASPHELRDLWAGFHDKSYRITKLYRVTPVCIPAAQETTVDMTVDARLAASQWDA